MSVNVKVRIVHYEAVSKVCFGWDYNANGIALTILILIYIASTGFEQIKTC